MATKKIFILKENLHRKYIEENLSALEVAKYFKCSVATINIYLSKYNIRKPTLQITKEDLYRKYIEEGKTTNIIAKEFNCSQPTILNYLKKFKIKKDRKQIYSEIKAHNIQKYGVENISQLKTTQEKIRVNNMKKYGISHTHQLASVKNKVKNTFMQNYGVEHPMKTELIKEKIKQTNISKYGVENCFQSEEKREKIKQTMLDRYGAQYPLQIEKFKAKLDYKSIKEKEYITKKKNNSFNTSIPEKMLYEELLQKYSSVIPQYKSKEYPWTCDFYIPDIQMYIELQKHWTHGKEPFDSTNKEHMGILNKWQEKAKTSMFYKNAIKVWTESDVKKRLWAKTHNLNFLEIF